MFPTVIVFSFLKFNRITSTTKRVKAFGAVASKSHALAPTPFGALEWAGLQSFHQICRAKGIAIIAEVMEAAQIEDLFESVDNRKTSTCSMR